MSACLSIFALNVAAQIDRYFHPERYKEETPDWKELGINPYIEMRSEEEIKDMIQKARIARGLPPSGRKS